MSRFLSAQQKNHSTCRNFSPYVFSLRNETFSLTTCSPSCFQVTSRRKKKMPIPRFSPNQSPFPELKISFPKCAFMKFPSAPSLAFHFSLPKTSPSASKGDCHYFLLPTVYSTISVKVRVGYGTEEGDVQILRRSWRPYGSRNSSDGVYRRSKISDVKIWCFLTAQIGATSGG